ANSLVDPRREHEPGDESSRANQHGEGIVIEVAGLQPHDVTGDIEDAGGDAVRSEAVDQPAVTALPKQTAEPFCRFDENRVVDLVEVPLVEQEAVKHIVLTREFDRNIGAANIEMPRNHKA